MSTPEFEITKQKVKNHLKKKQKNGINIVKSNQISSEVDISVKKVGIAMADIENQSTAPKIDRWGGSSNGTKWILRTIDTD